MKNATAAPGQFPEPERRLASERYLATQANAIIAGSAAEAAVLIGAVGAAAERTWVIPPGVDVDLFRPDRMSADAAVRRSLGIGVGQPILAVVGRLQALKNQELAVRTLAELDRLGGRPAVLVIAGEATPGDDDYLSLLHQTATTLGLQDRVRFVGALARESLADLLAVASVTVVPSRSETSDWSPWNRRPVAPPSSDSVEPDLSNPSPTARQGGWWTRGIRGTGRRR